MPAARRWRTSSAAARSLSSITSCSGPTTGPAARPCSTIADGFNGLVVHLVNHDVAFWAVSRAPLAKLQAYKRRMGWTFPWASSLGSDFNFDFNVSFTEEQQRTGRIDYNYQRGGHAMDMNDPCRHLPPSSRPPAAPTRDLRARPARHERVRARRWRRLPHLLDLHARPGRALLSSLPRSPIRADHPSARARVRAATPMAPTVCAADTRIAASISGAWRSLAAAMLASCPSRADLDTRSARLGRADRLAFSRGT